MSVTAANIFRIWIVNVFLTIITLGIYSAWAKVRREQYFHRNLMLDGSGFDYHGKPVAILKGRIVALLLVGALSAAQHFSPLAYGVAILCLLPLVPWLAVKAFRFRAYNTSYRGLRFSFHGTYGQAFKVFVGYGLLAMVTFWLAFPVFYRQLRKFILDNTRFWHHGLRVRGDDGYHLSHFPVPGIHRPGAVRSHDRDRRDDGRRRHRGAGCGGVSSSCSSRCL